MSKKWTVDAFAIWTVFVDLGLGLNRAYGTGPGGFYPNTLGGFFVIINEKYNREYTYSEKFKYNMDQDFLETQ